MWSHPSESNSLTDLRQGRFTELESVFPCSPLRGAKEVFDHRWRSSDYSFAVQSDGISVPANDIASALSHKNDSCSNIPRKEVLMNEQIVATAGGVRQP